MDTANIPEDGIGPNILRVVTKEVETLQSKRVDTRGGVCHGCPMQYNDCEWHDTGTGDCE